MLFVAVASFADLAGCMIVESPIRAVAGTEVVWGDVVTGESAAPGTEKDGKACGESILGLIAHGDASVRAAKANGRIKEVTSVDHSARNFVGDSRRVVHARAREIARRVPVVRRPRHAAR